MAIPHEGTERQGRWLRQVLRGWMAYYAVPMSGSAISAFRHHVIERWRAAAGSATFFRVLGRVLGLYSELVQVSTWLLKPMQSRGNTMAKLSRTRSRNKITKPRRERIRSLPAKPGTTIHYVNPDLVVVVEQKAGGAGGAGAKPKVKVCKCISSQFICTTDANGLTTCREQCSGWECTIIEGGIG